MELAFETLSPTAIKPMSHVSLVFSKGDNEHDFKEEFVRMDNEQKRQGTIYSVCSSILNFTLKSVGSTNRGYSALISCTTANVLNGRLC